MTMTKEEKAKEFEILVRDWNLREYHRNLTNSYYSGNHPELKFIIDMPIEDQYIWLRKAIDDYNSTVDYSFDTLYTEYPCPWMLVKMTLERRKKERDVKKRKRECPLNSKVVMDIFMDCMFRETPQPGTKFIGIEGIHDKIGFDPEKISLHKEEILDMLKYLPNDFNEDSGEGQSLLKAPFTKDDIQWGEQIDADRLMMLGMAIGKVKYLLPRNLWFILPGGVPYYCITKEINEPKFMEV